jgi:two-component system nitrate/nitrite response regulator NarP
MISSILVVESYPRLRRGIRRLLESDPAFRVISEASDASEAVRLTNECAPKVYLQGPEARIRPRDG